jgi:hypothetical protein
MYKYQLLFFPIFLLFTVYSSHAQKTQELESHFATFPLYEEVYTFLNKEISFPCSECNFGIAKKSDGYYLTLNYISEGKITNRNFVKVWDAETKKYITPQIDAFLITSTEEGENGLANTIYDDHRFDFMYVYGYPEWIADLENLLEHKENLSSKEYEMLARGTSEQASDFIHPNQYGSNLEETKNLSNPIYENISAERVEQFIKRSEKSLFYYNQIKKQTPNYQPMIITDLDLKIAHDQMHCYNYLMSVKETEAAKKFLNQVTYNEGYLSYARNILDACPNNSILITHGDTDSYPLWYLQDKLGYRKDIIVLNYSLMQTPWYMTMTKELYNYSTQFTKTDFTHFYVEPILMDEIGENEEVLPFNEWINLAKTRYAEVVQNRLNSNEEYDVRASYVFMPNSCMVTINGEELPVNITEYYIQMLDLVTLDLINSNANRKVCTTSPTAFKSLNLFQNCAKHGTVYELFSKELIAYSDDKSADFLVKRSKAIQPEMITLMKNVGMFELMLLYDDLKMLNDVPSIQKELFNQLQLKFPYTSLITNYNAELLAAFSEVAAEIDPKLNAKFKEEYSKAALELIDKVRIDSPKIKLEVLELHNIFQIYAEADWQLNAEKTANFTSIEKQVLTALQKKTKELAMSKRYENLIWTGEKINKLQKALESVKL